jgi:alkaline phosphatase
MDRISIIRAVAACTTIVVAGHALAQTPKNVILMVSDGASWGTWDMASYYEHGQKGLQPYDSFNIKLGMTTYPLNTSNTPKNSGVPEISYDPAQAWDTTPNVLHKFNGYQYIKANYTDSAAAGTALASGIKTYNNAINFDDFGNPVPFITQLAKQAGKATGVVSSVPFSHATPAAFGAQNLSRNNYHAIADQMINDPTLDLILGAGNPEYDNNAQPRVTPSYTWVSSTTWTNLKNGTAGGSQPWQLIQDEADFNSLASGALPAANRLIGVPKVGDTLQYNRTGTGMGNLNTGVPTLKTMTEGALNFLGARGGSDGFFVMIEGGAVDWAAHANNTGRIIEEQIDFNNSVKAAVNWIAGNGGWSENLLIVLTDHGNGMPMGPNSDTVAFEPIQNNGQGNLPGVKWHYGTHTNENTLFWANGAGSELFLNLIRGTDPDLVSRLAHNADGSYIDNTDVFTVMSSVVPEPASLALAAFGLTLLARRRRSA